MLLSFVTSFSEAGKGNNNDQSSSDDAKRSDSSASTASDSKKPDVGSSGKSPDKTSSPKPKNGSTGDPVKPEVPGQPEGNKSNRNKDKDDDLKLQKYQLEGINSIFFLFCHILNYNLLLVLLDLLAEIEGFLNEQMYQITTPARGLLSAMRDDVLVLLKSQTFISNFDELEAKLKVLPDRLFEGLTFISFHVYVKSEAVERRIGKKSS